MSSFFLTYACERFLVRYVATAKCMRKALTSALPISNGCRLLWNKMKLGEFVGQRWLMGIQLYGGGLRLLECLRQRLICSRMMGGGAYIKPRLNARARPRSENPVRAWHRSESRQDALVV